MPADAARLAVCSWSLKPTSCDELIAKLEQTGLTRIQLHLDPIAAGDEGWQNTPAKLAQAGITVVSGMVGCHGEDYSTIEAIERTGGVVPDATWPITRENFVQASNLAGDMGLKLVTFHAGFIPAAPDHPTRQTSRERLADVAAIFSANGVAIALETGQESAATLESMLADLGGEVGVNFDPANMLLYGSGEPVAALRALTARLKQVHLKDAVASGQAGEWGDEVPVGTGQVDWAGFFDALDAARFTGDLVIEREAGDDRVGDVQHAVSWLKTEGYVAGDTR
ncbi:MAG: sugar phosphate isomerase/epimerase family protein [Planctomycetota bacterium]